MHEVSIVKANAGVDLERIAGAGRSAVDVGIAQLRPVFHVLSIGSFREGVT